MMGERVGGPGDGPRKPNPKTIYGPKGGKLIEEVVLKGVKKSEGTRLLIQGYIDINKGFEDGVMDYSKDVYHFVTKNAYSTNWWASKVAETIFAASYIQDMNKIRPDGSTNSIDLLNSVSNASAYDVGHFTGYNSAQFATTAALTEGGGFLLNSIKFAPKVSKVSIPGSTKPAIDYTGGIDFSDPLLTFYHKGELNGGILNPSKGFLSTGTDFEAVNSLNRPGKVWKLEIRSSQIQDWRSKGINFMENRRDLDHATGVYNQEIRFKSSTFPTLQNHIK